MKNLRKLKCIVNNFDLFYRNRTSLNLFILHHRRDSGIGLINQSINQSILFYYGMAERRPTICTDKNTI